MGVPDRGMGGVERRWESLTGGMGRGEQVGVLDWGIGGVERRWESLNGGMGRGREEVGVPD